VGFKKSMSSVVQWRDFVAAEHLDSRAFPVLKTVNAVDLTPGPMIQTNNPLDVYVNGQGLIAVESKDGQEVYTRRGDLKITENGLITTGKGDLILGDGGPMTLPPSSRVEIGVDGTVSVVPLGDPAGTLIPVDRIKLVDATDEPMKIRPDGLYEPMRGGTLDADANVKLAVGALEGSTSTSMNAMVQMIKDAREYEMYVKVMKNARELAQSSASIVRMDA
jgi:flagellar basal-body rod protein FlgF